MMNSHPLYHRRRVIIFGSTGFIGRWVARALSQQGAEIYLFHRDAAGVQALLSSYGIEGTACPFDLADLDLVHKEIKVLQPDIVFNLAGYGVDRSEQDERQAYRINTELVESICSALDASPVNNWGGQRLVHVGSALEYGEIQSDLNEDSQPFPTTLYGKSKLAGTLKLKEFCEAQQLAGLTARLFTVYGPGEHAGRLFPSLVDASRTGKSLALTDGMQKRDFTFVEDVAEGLLRLGRCSAVPGSIVNLATGTLSSVRRFIETASEILPIQANQLNFGALPTRSYEMDHLPVSIDKLVKLVSWRPPTTIEDGIRKTWLFEKDVQSKK
jgi:nucleoside-diphosphate-sugar epimerase